MPSNKNLPHNKEIYLGSQIYIVTVFKTKIDKQKENRQLFNNTTQISALIRYTKKASSNFEEPSNINDVSSKYKESTHALSIVIPFISLLPNFNKMPNIMLHSKNIWCCLLPLFIVTNSDKKVISHYSWYSQQKFQQRMHHKKEPRYGIKFFSKAINKTIHERSFSLNKK